MNIYRFTPKSTSCTALTLRNTAPIYA
jgi:hypothetical protein